MGEIECLPLTRFTVQPFNTATLRTQQLQLQCFEIVKPPKRVSRATLGKWIDFVFIHMTHHTNISNIGICIVSLLNSTLSSTLDVYMFFKMNNIPF